METVPSRSSFSAKICLEERENCQVWGLKHKLAPAVACLTTELFQNAGNTGEAETRLAPGVWIPQRWQGEHRRVRLRDGASGSAGSPGTSRLGHLQQRICGQRAAGHSQCSLPQEAHVPDGLVLQLWPKQGVQLGQDGDEPEEVTADGSGHQHGDDHPAVGSFGHEPGPSDADEAPECGEDDDREGKGVRCHGWEQDVQVRCRMEQQTLQASARTGRGQ